MNKKLTVLTALVLCFALCLSACGLKPIEESEPSPGVPSSTPTPAAKPSEQPSAPSEKPQEPEAVKEAPEHRTVAASGTDIPEITDPNAASETDIPSDRPSAASSTDVTAGDGSYTVGLGSDNRFYAQNEPQIVAGQLVFFVEEAFWEDAGLTIACTILNGTDKKLTEPDVKRLEAANAETLIADVKVGVLEGCEVEPNGSEYWEFFIPKSYVASPYALLNTLMITVTLA